MPGIQSTRHHGTASTSAAGRAGGPLLGGVLIDTLGATALGVVGAGLVLISAIGVFTVRNVAPPLPNA